MSATEIVIVAVSASLVTVFVMLAVVFAGRSRRHDEDG